MEAVEEVAGRFTVRSFGDVRARLMLAKNPAGWDELLDLVVQDDAPLVVSINARVADGADPSWLWDVPFERLAGRTRWWPRAIATAICRCACSTPGWTMRPRPTRCAAVAVGRGDGDGDGRWGRGRRHRELHRVLRPARGAGVSGRPARFASPWSTPTSWAPTATGATG